MASNPLAMAGRAAYRLLLVVPTMLSSLTSPNTNPNSSPIPPSNQLNITHQWSQIDFAYASSADRSRAIKNGEFIQNNVIPFGIDVWKDRVFVTLPKLREGVPATLATVPRVSNTFSPILEPYPDWNFHKNRTNCTGMTSVFRVASDPCGRLWVLDSGKVDAAFNATEKCPPQLFIFDLYNDKLMLRYVFPKNHTLIDNLFVNIVVDYQGDCEDVYAYMADTERYTMLVYSLKNRTSWMISHGSFYPDPQTFGYKVDSENWYWNYGINALALGPMTSDNDRRLYYHASGSYKEYYVPTSVLKNPATVNANRNKFVLLGERGYSRSHAAGSAVSRTGVLFYGLPEHHVAACWDTNNTDFSNLEQGVIGFENSKLAFPNDVIVDHDTNQSVWILNNNFHKYLFGKISSKSANYMILRGDTKTAVRKTVCSPSFNLFNKYRASNVSADYETTSERTAPYTVETSTQPTTTTTPRASTTSITGTTPAPSVRTDTNTTVTNSTTTAPNNLVRNLANTLTGGLRRIFG